MHWSLVDDADEATYVVVMDQGDEAFSSLSSFARDQDLAAAQVTAVGAFSRAVLGWYDRERQEYRRIPIDQQCEVLLLVGDVAVADDGPQVHVHAVVGLPDGSTRGGHLLEGHVWPTLEIVLRESPAVLHKTYRPEVGLALIDLPASET